jgi:hypothetical protein
MPDSAYRRFASHAPAKTRRRPPGIAGGTAPTPIRPWRGIRPRNLAAVAPSDARPPYGGTPDEDAPIIEKLNICLFIGPCDKCLILKVLFLTIRDTVTTPTGEPFCKLRRLTIDGGRVT